MPDSRRVHDLAEAVADGRTSDWTSAERGSADPAELQVIANLRAVQSIHGLMTLRTARRADEAGRIVLAPGATWGGLEVKAHVGRGRFGDVYRAWDPALEREVALKLVRLDAGADDVGTQVVEEGRLMARVRHPNVVTIHGAQRIDGVSGLWMEFVAGRTLAADLAEHGPFAADELKRVGTELAGALEAVHQAGLVHRDVKAQNVLREASGRIVLGDFGTGRELDDPDETRGGLAGTPSYLAPEIFVGQPATRQSDLYSLGALLFYLATGTFPVRGQRLRELRDAHSRGERASLAALRSDLPARLTAVIERALDPDAARRFESADAMRGALDAAVGVPKRAAHPRSRLAGAAALVVTLAGLGAALSMRASPPSSPEPVAAPALVLVTAFENRTGEPVFDDVLEFALERELGASPVVSVASRLRIQDTLALMRRPLDTRIDLSVGREVALRDGEVRALVAGQVLRVATTYVVAAEILRPADGTVVARVSEEASSQTAVVSAVSRLALAVRGQLGEALPMIQAGSTPPLPRVTTSSLRALQVFAQVDAMLGDDGVFDGPPQAVERLLLEVLAEDPDFAAAHRHMARAIYQGGFRTGTPRLADALAHVERAVALSASVGPAERILSQAHWHLLNHMTYEDADRPEAVAHANGVIDACEALLQLNADDVEASRLCTDFYRLTGSPNERFATRQADRRPNAAGWQTMAAWAILVSDPNAIDRARVYFNRAAAMVPTRRADASAIGEARIFEAHEAWLQNRPDDALAIADRVAGELATLDPELRDAWEEQVMPMYVDLGQLDRAEQLERGVVDAHERRLGLVFITLYREDRARLRAMLAESYPDITAARSFATPFIEAGLVAESRRLVAMHRIEGPRPHLLRQYRRMLEGGLAMIENRPDDAIASFEAFLEYNPRLPHPSREARVRRWLATTWMAKGDIHRAIQVLEAAPTRRRDVMGHSTGSQADWLQNREFQARLYRQVNRVGEAEAIEAELTTLLALADDDHPIKRRLEARARDAAPLP